MQAGMTEPVVQCERLTFNYATAKDALREVHKQGAGCALADRPRGLMGKARWQKALSHYERRFADDNGRVPATYEVIYAVAWRAATQEKRFISKESKYSYGFLFTHTQQTFSTSC